MLMNVISNRIGAGGVLPLKPCLDDLEAWNILSQVQELSGGVWGVPNKIKPTDYTFIFEGDSISSPRVEVDIIYPDRFAAMELSKGRNITVVNVAAPGDTVNSMISQAATEIDPLYDKANAVVNTVFMGGVNDWAQSGTITKETLYVRIRTWILARRALGFTVTYVTLLDATVPSHAGWDVARRWINDKVIQVGLANYVVDLSNTPVGATDAQLSTVYFLDEIHPTDAGHAIIAAELDKVFVENLSLIAAKDDYFIGIINKPVAIFDGVAKGTLDTEINLGTSHTISFTTSDLNSASNNIFVCGASTATTYIRLLPSLNQIWYQLPTERISFAYDPELASSFVFRRIGSQLVLYTDGIPTEANITGGESFLLGKIASYDTTVADSFSLHDFNVRDENDILVLDFSITETDENILYDSSASQNDCTITLATFPGFWGFGKTGIIRPRLALDGVFLRNDGVLIAKGVDTSAMTGIELPPFSWDQLPHQFKFEDVAAFALWKKDNAAVWGTSFPAPADILTWTIAELLSIPHTILPPYDHQLWVKTPIIGPLKDVLTYSVPLIVGSACDNKTEKYTGSNQWDDEKIWDDSKTWED